MRNKKILLILSLALLGGVGTQLMLGTNVRANAAADEQPADAAQTILFDDWYNKKDAFNDNRSTISNFGSSKGPSSISFDDSGFIANTEGHQNYFTYTGDSYLKYNKTGTTIANGTAFNGLTTNSASTGDVTLTFNFEEATKVRLLGGIDSSNVNSSPKAVLSGATTGSVADGYISLVPTSKASFDCAIAGKTYTFASKARYFEFDINAGITTLTLNPTSFDTSSTNRKFFLYAIETYYLEQSYTVTYDMNGATSAQIPSESVKYGDTFSEPADPTRNGYVFHGWHTQDDVHYKFETRVSKDIDLVAVWYNQSLT